MLQVACCLWDANEKSEPFSRCYDESWVNKLAAGFRRNLSRPFRFVVFTDRARTFAAGIEQEPLAAKNPDYGCLTEPYRLDEPMILVGLDTVVVKNIDHFADYCLSAEKVALPRNPYKLEQSINAVALVPAGQRRIYDEWRGENDMDWMRKQDTAFIDDFWPGQVVSLKAHRIRDVGLGEARIVYFHGHPKPPKLLHLDWIKQHWRADDRSEVRRVVHSA